jgi:hypothetical protein
LASAGAYDPSFQDCTIGTGGGVRVMTYLP